MARWEELLARTFVVLITAEKFFERARWKSADHYSPNWTL